MAVCKSSEGNSSSYTQNFKELSWVFLNSRLHSAAAIERRTIVCWEIAFSRKSYRIETSQCKCKSIDRFLYNTNSFFVSRLLVNNKILLGQHHPWEFFFFLCLITGLQKRKRYKMDSMETGQFIAFSISFFLPRNM